MRARHSLSPNLFNNLLTLLCTDQKTDSVIHRLQRQEDCKSLLYTEGKIVRFEFHVLNINISTPLSQIEYLIPLGTALEEGRSYGGW